MITKDTEFTFIIDINKMPFVTIHKDIDNRKSILFTLNIKNPKVTIKAGDLSVYAIELIYGYIESGVLSVTNKEEWDEFIEYIKTKTIKKKENEENNTKHVIENSPTETKEDKNKKKTTSVVDITVDELLKLNVNKIKAKLKELKSSLSLEDFNEFINNVEEQENKSESPRISLLKYITELREKE